MSRPARIVLLFLVVILGLGGVSIGTAAGALAASKPAISKVGSGAGPVKPTTLTIKGTHLAGATAVKFGGKKGTIVQNVSATEVEVRTPKGMHAGGVAVRIRTKAGWSAPSKKAHYTFVSAPSLTKSTPASGSFTGGQKVTLRGKNLGRTTKVLFGKAKATIVSRSAGKVVVKTPVGVLGKTTIKLTTPGGTSRGKAFTFVRPARKAAKTITPAATTFVPAEVEWVTGGYDADTGELHPWVVGLPQRAASPVVGKPFLVKPGTSAFPSGLAGTVDMVAVQTDESVRVTVDPTDFSKSLKQLSVNYAGPLGGSTAAVAAQALDTAVEFPIDASALFCHDEDGRSVAFGADFTMRVTDTDVTQNLDAGSLFRKPSYDGAFTAEVETTGKFHGEGASTCHLKTEWAKAHEKTFLLGTTGATVSIRPDFEFSVSAKGTLTVLDRTRTTYAVNAKFGKLPRLSKTSHTVKSEYGGALSFDATLAGGIKVEFGELDRVGVQGTVLVGVSVGLEASNTNVCIDGKIVLKLSVGLFFDFWVDRWESPTLTAGLDLYKFAQKCVRAETEPPATGEPQITSARLPDAQIGTDYNTTLATADNRAGRWSVVRFSLPAGLSLDADSGTIAGTPTGPVGDSAVIIDFVDGDGKGATTTIRIDVLPTSGLGGGDIQVTLRWTGPADLDLHVVDPAGEEIYYGHQTSASGGTLDHDANAGCNGTEDDDNAVENVFWPPHSAPPGGYTASVHVYAVCDGALDWHLEVRRNGAVIIDQSGTGDSPGYEFTVGAGAAAAVRTVSLPSQTYPAK